MSEQRIEAKLPDYGTRTDEITIYAGPCSVESEEQFFEVAECISDLGLTWIRGRRNASRAPTRTASRALARKPLRS